MRTFAELSKAEAESLRAALRTELGLPRVAVASDRVGTGIFAPLETVVTREAVEVFDVEGKWLVPAEAVDGRITKLKTRELLYEDLSVEIATDTRER
jgi:hypothetical protein